MPTILKTNFGFGYDMTIQDEYDAIKLLLKRYISTQKFNLGGSIKLTSGTFNPDIYNTIALGDWRSCAYDHGAKEEDFIKKDFDYNSSKKYLYYCTLVGAELNFLQDKINTDLHDRYQLSNVDFKVLSSENKDYPYFLECKLYSLDTKL